MIGMWKTFVFIGQDNKNVKLITRIFSLPESDVH